MSSLGDILEGEKYLHRGGLYFAGMKQVPVDPHLGSVEPSQPQGRGRARQAHFTAYCRSFGESHLCNG